MSAPLHDGEGPSAVTEAEVEAAACSLVRLDGHDDPYELVMHPASKSWEAPSMPRWEVREEDARTALLAAAAARTPSPAEACLRAEVEAMRQAGRRLILIFHDAVRRPLGVVPASGDEFYDSGLGAMAELRRPLVGAPDLTPDRGGDDA